MKISKLNEIHFTRFEFNSRIVNNVLRIVFYIFLKLYRSLIGKKSSGAGIVIISLHRLGDTVFTLPAIKAILDHYAEENIIILCYKSGKDIYEYFLGHYGIITLKPDMFKFGNRIADRRARKILKDLNPALVIDISTGLQAVSLFINSRTAKIIGINREIYRGAYDTFTAMRTTPPLIDMYIDAVKPVLPDYNFDRHIIKPSISISDKILIQPFAGWESKEWGINKFIELSLFLKRNYNVEFISESGKINKELKLELSRIGLSLIECASVTELLKEIEKCFLMISNDTGAIHLAAALGKATYTIYGPTNPAFSLPAGLHHGFTAKKLPCTPVIDDYCFTFAGREGCPSFECMRQLSLVEVRNDLEKFLYQIELSFNKHIK